MSTNPLERIPKRSPKTSATDLNEFAKTAGSTAASAAYPIMLGLTGEDTGDEWYEDLAYGAVPGGALVQRAKTGTIPGLLDLLPGDVGAGARLAMLPIAKFGAEEIAKGAARMGKSARNVSEAMEKKANPTVVRYHRTLDDNVADIMREGLVPNSRNQGKNTSNQHQLPDMVWLGNNPTEIPVLRLPLEKHPEDVAEFKVKIPSDVYYNTPRYKFPNGRGWGNPQLVPKGEPSLSNEGSYKIDTFGSTITPDMLERIPNAELQEMLVRDDRARELAWTLINSDPNSTEGLVRSRLRRENPALGERVDRAVEEIQAGDDRLIDRDAFEQANIDLPISSRYSNTSDEYEKVLKKASRNISNAMKQDKWGVGLFHYTPYARLKDALNQLPVNEQGRVVTQKYYPSGTRLSDLVKGDPDDVPMPEELGGFTNTMPGADQIAKGAVSHGGGQDWPTLKQRHFDYDTYNENIAQGYPPAVAADFATPYYKFMIDPDDATGTRWGWYTSNDRKGNNYGMITEGEGDYFAMRRVKDLMDYARQYGLNPDRRAELHNLFQDVLRRGTIGSYVPSKDKFSEFTPGSRLPDWDPRR